MTDDGALADRAESWADADPDLETRRELLLLVEALRGAPPGDPGRAAAAAALRERMDAPLTFGTAGLRGVVGAGPSRMNHAVVRRTTRALADYLLATGPEAPRGNDGAARPTVVVGFDARHSSRAFAETVIGVLTAAGVAVRYFEESAPTPLVAYALGRLGADAAVVVTASHNPPEYNGYKLYGRSGSQIIAPVDSEIERRIQALGPARTIPVRPSPPSGGDALALPVPSTLVDAYLAEVDGLRPRGPADRELPIVYTPLHGVGGALATRALAQAGFTRVRVVPSQAAPDGDFPTVRFPNPEEPGALEHALALAADSGAELVLANDPDADRLAVAVRSPSGRLVTLSGNQVGLLLADYLLTHASPDRPPLVVWSVVSSPALAAIAGAHGARAERTLTGFKWIAHAGRELEAREGYRFVFGYEEAIGYEIGAVVRDKDGISAALVFAELAAAARARGEGVLDVLARLYRRHGLWVSAQRSVAAPGAGGVGALVAATERLAASPPRALAGVPVEGKRDYRDGADLRPEWLGATFLVELLLGGRGRVLLRPSGTEPKLKIYVDLREDLDPSSTVWDAEARLSALASEIAGAAASALAV